ncbi:DUF6705 family protein [Flavobacterium sp.]|jgi:hypothetical protein|uniref:DUF6705 family protein n=1 Tax=Flavobacterium sp. TaxID=239 RepID=UPI0037C07D7B
MKKTIILLVICFTYGCKAQTYTLGVDSPNIIPPGSYFQDSNHILERFIGTWVFNQNGQNFKVTLNKIEQRPLSNYYRDDIIGSYIYSINGNTVVNTEGFIGDNSKIETVFINSNNNKISLFFYDPERPKIGAKVILNYSNVGGVEKLHWELLVTGYLPVLPGESSPQLDFRVPTNCELIKQ